MGKQEKPSQCTWTENSDGTWETTCGNAWIFLAGTPSDNQVRWCPYCGRVLHEVRYRDDAV
jgi:hypothetical protein